MNIKEITKNISKFLEQYMFDLYYTGRHLMFFLSVSFFILLSVPFIICIIYTLIYILIYYPLIVVLLLSIPVYLVIYNMVKFYNKSKGN